MWFKSKIDFLRGQKAYRKGDFQVAFEYFNSAKKSGEQSAAFMCGIMLINGEAGYVDFARGIELANKRKAILVKNSRRLLNKTLLDYYGECGEKGKYVAELEIAANEFLDYMALDELIYLNYCGRLGSHQASQNKEKACWYLFIQRYFSDFPVPRLSLGSIAFGVFPIAARKLIAKILYKFSDKKELSTILENFVEKTSPYYGSDEQEALARKIYAVLKEHGSGVPSYYVILMAIVPLVLQMVLPLGNDIGLYSILAVFNKYLSILSITVTLFVILAYRSNLFLTVLFLISSGIFNIISVLSVRDFYGFHTKTIATVCLIYALAGIIRACLFEPFLKRRFFK
ncbi:MAG: hypothetical protein WCH10_05630 [bacterium]